MQDVTDIIIIGAGPAGMTAALYAKRAGASVKILESSVCGGQLATSFEVSNYPGVATVSGADLAFKMFSPIKDFVLYERVTEILNGEYKTVKTVSGEHKAKSVIIANGAINRKLGVPGEAEYLGQGVSYCAVCDGNLFKEKTVCVIGGGNTALEEVLYLSSICKKVILLHRSNSFKAEKYLVDRVTKLENENAEIVYSFDTLKIEKEADILTVYSKDNSVKCNGIFIAIGRQPENSFALNLVDLDNKGYIKADESCKTNVPGIFAAGDTRTKALRQVVTATADGAAAAQGCLNYIQDLC